MEKTLALDIHAAIKTRIAAKLGLKPLQEDGVSDFIRYRLKAAKANPELFSKEAMKLIELDPKGNRRVIMNIASNCKDLAVLREKRGSRRGWLGMCATRLKLLLKYFIG